MEASESISELLRATHVLHLVVEHATFGAWVPEPDGSLQQRWVDLTLRLEAILKGALDVREGESVAVRVQQRGTGSFRVAGVDDVWSNIAIAPNLEFVAYTSGDGPLTSLLQPTWCFALAGVDTLPEVKTTLAIERAHLSPPRVLVEVVHPLTSCGGVMARYVWARVGASALSEPQLFESVLQIVERPETTSAAREVLLLAMLDDVSMLATPPNPVLRGLARAMLVVLGRAGDEDLRHNVATVLLPNVLGLPTPPPALGATEVLGSDFPLRLRILGALAQSSELDPDGALRRWIEAE